MATYIVDIDGTIADNQHRQWVLADTTRPQVNWELFFQLMVNDSPHLHMQQLLYDLTMADAYGHSQAQIIYVTGRPERFRAMTVAWLRHHHFPVPSKHDDEVLLIMRGDGDHRPDAIIKRELLGEIRKQYEVTMAFDDRNSVVKMWRAAGIPCAQVAEGDF